MDWNGLQTITQFDDLSDTPSSNNDITMNIKNDKNLQKVKLVDCKNVTELSSTRPTTSTSLLIESLIQLLCVTFEENQDTAKQSYRKICDQLNEMNLIDNSYQLNEFDETRGQYQMQIYKIICASRGQDVPILLPTTTTLQQQQSVETCWSRYCREFDEIDFIAGGGFGRVYRARHKLDCIEYAIKQIKINSTSIKLCHLAEVKTIASLNHPNIVQYKAAWLELYSPSKSSMKKETNSTDFESTDVSETKLSQETDDNCEDEPLINDLNEDESSEFIQFEHGSQENTNSTNDLEYTNKLICKYSERRRSQQQLAETNRSAILYIQMSLCQLTLRKWLKERNECDSFKSYYIDFFGATNEPPSHLDVVNDIFTQILSGLDYIHSRNIIHHDIKPSNIFLALETNGKLIVQLGDFGLACPLQDNHRGLALGTPQYAAPEQLNGECNPKSDIYSLGIVLLELLLSFKTDMERIKIIENARKEIFPPELSKQSMKLLKSLLGPVDIRPSTKDILEVVRTINLEQQIRSMKLPQLRDDQIRDLRKENQKLKEKDEHNLIEINRLLIQLEKKDDEMKKIRELLLLKDKEILELKKSLHRKSKHLNSV